MPKTTPGVFSLLTTSEDAGRRLDQFLAAHLPDLSRARVQRLIAEGHVRIGRGRIRPSLALAPGLAIEVAVPAAAPAVPQPQALPLSILYDDDDMVVVDKPAGMVVHPAAGHAGGTLVNALLHHVKGLSGIGGALRPGIVHRLDRGTSGVMVVAKHDRAHRALARQFHDREVGKEYVALVWGAMKPGRRFETAIGRDPRHRHRMSSRARHARPALSQIVSVEPYRGVSLVRVKIGTGRTHQIRVHLSEAGHPIVGDAVYGGARKRLPAHLAALAGLDRPFLHAARLTVAQPTTGQPLTFDAPLPPDLAARLAALDRRGS
ncbi:MAG TPA: RluA family pseudouridine synthase [Vicinamibacterales bacterium]|nr:RluA family pseudouridine synthase [Vicinamibacterales bacterium]